jgi:lambda repressor-like predicted transcriptional regulator
MTEEKILRDVIALLETGGISLRSFAARAGTSQFPEYLFWVVLAF